MNTDLMTLKILLPHQVFTVKTGVMRIVAESINGSLGILPHRLDCVAALEPGILTYENESEGESFFAVNTGILIKTGLEVRVLVRAASKSASLEELRSAVEADTKELDEQEEKIRSAMQKLESNMIDLLVRYHHGR